MASRYKGNEMIWENLHERMELPGHLKVIVPLGIGMNSGCRLRSRIRSVVHELCHLKLVSKLKYTWHNEWLGANYHLSCPVKPVNRAQQHTM